MKILVIDTDSSRMSALKTLESSGHLVQSLASWLEVREFLELVSFQMLILGPEQDFQTVSEWQQSRDEKCTPVIVAMNPRSEAQSPAAETFHCLELPLDANRVAALPSLPGAPLEPEALNQKAAIDVCDSDEDLFREIAGIFLREGPRRMEVMSQAMEAQDWHGVAEAAHLMKGSALNLVAGPLRYSTKYLERAAEAGRPQYTRFWYMQVRYEYERLSRRLTDILKGPVESP